MQLIDAKGSLQAILAAQLRWEWAKEIEDSIMQPIKNRNNSQALLQKRLQEL
jgi:hypothetical protein